MFYIQPPLGQVTLHVLESCVLSRLEYLGHLYHNTTNDFTGNFEYLLENSIHDRVGHFVLRLLAATSLDLETYWLMGETLFLKHRLAHITFRQLHRLFRSIIRQIKSSKNKETLISKTLIRVSAYFLQSLIFEHISLNNHKDDCRDYHCKVRYELIPNLVKVRGVDLAAGQAIIYCSQWRELLESLFHTFITKELNSMKFYALNTVNTDPRLNVLNQIIHTRVLRGCSKPGRITASNIDTESQKFPLCMKHLHILLRQRHRLSHYARFYYSLLLKECGMKVDDALIYWKEEYSKPHTCTSSCVHNWQTNEKKFVYSIRHLYGLEGSRKNYKAPNCTNICTNIAGPNYEGGCPFQNFDNKTIKNLLGSSLPENKVENFLKTIENQKPEAACTQYFRVLHKNNDDSLMISSPVQYYLEGISSNHPCSTDCK